MVKVRGMFGGWGRKKAFRGYCFKDTKELAWSKPYVGRKDEAESTFGNTPRLKGGRPLGPRAIIYWAIC